MKRTLALLALVGAVLLSTGPVLADSDFYVIAGGGGVGTKITSLPFPIKNSGFYYLGSNLTCASGDAIDITADNVVLDLMGFTITGNTSSYGIYFTQSNVEIRNGTVTGCKEGIFGNGQNNRVVNVKLTNHAHCAVELYGGSALIKDSLASNSGDTTIISTMFVASGTITGCTACNNPTGGIGASGPGLITNNVADSNTTSGIRVGNDIYINGNCALNNSGSGNYYLASGTDVVWGMNVGNPPHMNYPTPFVASSPSKATSGNNNSNMR
jgi:hypothetical protein